MKNERFYEKSFSANRNLLALILVILTIVALVIITALYFFNSNDEDVADRIFNSLLPLFATWIGTILAFYFGRENFEVATNRYNQLITQLTPDLLDDVLVSQVMITRKTLVGQNIEDIKGQSISKIIDFLKRVGKSRLPIFEGDEIVYIIHISTLLDIVQDEKFESDKFEDVLKDDSRMKLLRSFETILETEKLESARNIFSQNTDIKDIFVKNSNGTVTGWLTDSLVYRFVKS